LVWLRGYSHKVCLPLALFAIQLVLNVAWSVVFLGLHSTTAGLIDIVALWFAATWLSFRRASALAGWLLIPYLGWVTFAVALNFAIWQFDRSL